MARKAKERLPGLAVLFTSGYTENAIVHGGRLDRGVELIGKPYTKECLARKIRHVLANEQQRQADTPQHVQGNPEMQVARAKLKVLLVEDDQDIRDNTCDMIQFLGYNVIAVGSAEEAMEHLTLEIDILVSDLQLPGIQGDDLIQLAKARVPHLRVLLASGLGSTNLRGVEALPKPYSLDTLRTKLLGVSNVSSHDA